LKKDYWDRVREGLSRPGGPDNECEYYPCHHLGQDCSLCFCPFYPCGDTRLGHYVPSRSGGTVWSCQDCFWIHRPDVALEARERLAGKGRPDRGTLTQLKSSLENKHSPLARSIMVMGATSGAGKTLVAAALCRILSDLGYRVAPFKSQNMSSSSSMTAEGGEIAQAQALQALAARVDAEAHMNPILLKPKRDDVSQVFVLGRPYRDMDVPTYYGHFVTEEGAPIVWESYHNLQRRFDFIVIEGAGSPAEINIMDVDLANIGTAELTDSPCILVVNIEWGGAFAYAYGTLLLLPPRQRERFRGIIINNLRGDAASLQTGIDELERLTGIPVLGVIPHIQHTLPEEDSLKTAGHDWKGITVGVIRLPHISNFTDLDALEMEPGTSVTYIGEPTALSRVDAILIPGSENVRSDLQWLHKSGLERAIKQRRGEIPILGVGGGYEILGDRMIGSPGQDGGGEDICNGLGLLRAVTHTNANESSSRQVEGMLASGEGIIQGYMLNDGITVTEETPLFLLHSKGEYEEEGSWNSQEKIMGTHVYGLFDLPEFRKKFLSLCTRTESAGEVLKIEESIEENIKRLAKVVREHLDIARVFDILEGN